MPERSPWHGFTDDQLAVPGHDPDTCPSCSLVGTAYRDGAERAYEVQAVLPLTSGTTGA